MKIKFGEIVKSIDVYGQPFTVNFKGSETHKTYVGAFFTLLTYGFLIFYAVVRFEQRLLRDTKPQISQY